MTLTDKLPEQFTQIPTLEICSNTLIDTQSLLGIKDFSPLLIGKGLEPRIWLYTMTPQKKWLPLIVDNVSKHPEITCNSFGRNTSVKSRNVLIINAVMKNEVLCLVDNLDLRPIGLDVHGDANGLLIGNHSFKGNTIRGTKFAIGLQG